MAMGFGTSVSGSNNNRYALSSVDTPTALTIACFFKNYDPGADQYPRILQFDYPGYLLNIRWQRTENNWVFERGNGSLAGVWTWAALSYDTVYSLVLTHDGSNVANDPIVYINGSSVSVTESQAPDANWTSVGVPTYSDIGNRQNNERPFQGWIERFTMWNVVLTSGEALQFHQGYATSGIQGASRIYAAAMIDNDTESIQGSASYTGTTLVYTGEIASSPAASQIFLMRRFFEDA